MSWVLHLCSHKLPPLLIAINKPHIQPVHMCLYRLYQAEHVLWLTLQSRMAPMRYNDVVWGYETLGRASWDGAEACRACKSTITLPTAQPPKYLGISLPTLASVKFFLIESTWPINFVKGCALAFDLNTLFEGFHHRHFKHGEVFDSFFPKKHFKARPQKGKIPLHSQVMLLQRMQNTQCLGHMVLSPALNSQALFEKIFRG